MASEHDRIRSGGTRFRRSAPRIGVLALMLSWPLAAGGALPPVAVSFQDLGDSTMRLEGSFTAAGSSATAWNVLTDYDRISAFVASMRSSRVKARGSGFLLVEQESVARLLLFHRTFRVLLQVRETPRRTIAFVDVARTSFERYEGTWTLQEAPGGVAVTYLLIVKGGLVGILTRGPSRAMVRDLLEQVRAEIDHRAVAASSHGASGSPAALAGP
jgi:hypothetical protein